MPLISHCPMDEWIESYGTGLYINYTTQLEILTPPPPPNTNVLLCDNYDLPLFFLSLFSPASFLRHQRILPIVY